MRLKDQVVIVTGGSRGIGAALAEGLAAEGARVVVNYVQAAGAAQEIVGRIRDCGREAFAIQADVADLDAQTRLLSATMERFGRLDVLVNNAAVEFREPFLSTKPEIWDRTLEVNLKAPYFLSQKAAEVMRSAGKGKIINLSSVHDNVPLRGRSAYACSKAGLAMMTKALALELAEYHINVNAVSPGAILTDMNRQHLSVPEVKARLLERIPWNRLGEVQDVVGMTVFLSSAESDYVTGAVFYVDGGLLLRRL
jgi:glucose 1-dehydrogenase